MALNSALRAFRIKRVFWRLRFEWSMRQNAIARPSSASTNCTCGDVADAVTRSSAPPTCAESRARKTSLVRSIASIAICRASEGASSKPSFSRVAKACAWVQLINGPNCWSTSGPARFSTARHTTAARPQKPAVSANWAGINWRFLDVRETLDHSEYEYAYLINLHISIVKRYLMVKT